tara:strand:+ start:272 stop:1105 length:834 start_codon:yes stop_codon:yes gene_type:complete
MTRELDTFTRRSIILKKLNFENSKSVFSLSKECNVSLATIRRDLNALEKEGSLLRTHGGATLKSSASNQRFTTRENISKEEKIQIAHSALEFIKPGISIAMNDGTTNYYFSKLLLNLKKNLTIITSGINTAIVLSENKNFLCYLAGGQVKNSVLATSGSHAENMIESYNPDIAFISADGFTPQQGLTFAYEGEANIAKKMIKRSKKSIALITEEKLNIIENISSASCKEVDILITCSKKDYLLKPFKEKKMKVINAKINKKTAKDSNSNVIKFNDAR